MNGPMTRSPLKAALQVALDREKPISMQVAQDHREPCFTIWQEEVRDAC